MKNLFAGFVLYITLLPLTQANFILSFQYFDVSPSYLFGFIIIVVCLSQLYFKNNNEKVLKSNLKIAIAAFILSIIISIAFSPLVIIGIKDLIKFLFFIAIVIVAINLVDTELRSYYLMKWWFISICIFSGLCLLFFLLEIKPFNGYFLIHEGWLSFSVVEIEYDVINRISAGVAYKGIGIGLGNNPDKLAGLNFIGIFLGIGLMRYNKRLQTIFIILIIMLMVNLLLTYTRSAWLGALIGFCWMIYNTLRRGRKKFQALALFLLVMIVPASILIFEPLRTRFSDTFEKKDASEYGRELLWENLLDMVKQNPVKGVGPGVSLTTLGTLAYEKGLSTTLQSKTSGHNAVLTLWAELGTLGLLTFGSLIYLGLFAKGGGAIEHAGHGAGFKVLLESIRASLLAWTFFMCFHPEYTPWFWVLLGTAIGMGTRIRASEVDKPYPTADYSQN